jgi:hypothetical protein
VSGPRAARPDRAALWLLGGLAAGALLGAGVGLGYLPAWLAVAAAAVTGVVVGRKAFAGRRLR